MDAHTLDNGTLKATVKSAGAELVRLDFLGRPLLWGGDPAVWGRHAPHLFPFVGKLRDDALTVDGRTAKMGQHGFARDRDWSWETRDGAACRLALRDDEASRAAYPFAFRLAVGYTLSGGTLRCDYELSNTGDRPLPASLGAHPGFVWPLPGNDDRTAHRLLFDQPETEGVRRLQGGLLDPKRYDSPVVDRVLRLDDRLFATDAIIFDRPASASVQYGAPGAPTLTVAWENFPHLGIWSKPGAGFLCIEPWQGHSGSADDPPEFKDKPGTVTLAPGESRRFAWCVTVEA